MELNKNEDTITMKGANQWNDVDQTVYGHISIDATNDVLYSWSFKIIAGLKNIMYFGIDASNKYYTEQLLFILSTFFLTQNFGT